MYTPDELYQQLMTLTENNEGFYFIDQEYNGRTYRVFSYRLASYSDFCLPGALECRGHTFYVNDGAVTLVSAPPNKFFNLAENPFTQNVDPSRIRHIMTKEDGSLISVSVHMGKLLVKSKTSFGSDQAVAARKLIEADPRFENHLFDVCSAGYTVNMEYTAPDNRIVLGYEKPALTILNIRKTRTGHYLTKDELVGYGEIYRRWVQYHDIDDPTEFLTKVPSMEGIEGFIYVMDNGQMIKHKTDWYVTLHRAKDSINTPSKVFEAVIMETADDLKTLFRDDPVTLAMIAEIEEKSVREYNAMIARVEAFYNENKDLERKDYAIKARDLADGYMPLYMNKYIQRPEGYKEFALKNAERFLA